MPDEAEPELSPEAGERGPEAGADQAPPPEEAPAVAAAPAPGDAEREPPATESPPVPEAEAGQADLGAGDAEGEDAAGTAEAPTNAPADNQPAEEAPADAPAGLEASLVEPTAEDAPAAAALPEEPTPAVEGEPEQPAAAEEAAPAAAPEAASAPVEDDAANQQETAAAESKPAAGDEPATEAQPVAAEPEPEPEPEPAPAEAESTPAGVSAPVALPEPTGPPALYQNVAPHEPPDVQAASGTGQAESAKPAPAPAVHDSVDKGSPAPAAKAHSRADADAGTKLTKSTSHKSATSSSPAKKGKGHAASLGDDAVPATSTIKSHQPWLEGAFRTPKGRIITAQELCQSIDKMTSAHMMKYLNSTEGAPSLPAGYEPKKLPPDELQAVIDRLYTTKGGEAGEAFQLEHVKLAFDDNGVEQWVPVKKADPEEQRSYLCSLYERCLEQKKKTEDELAAKYLQPLGKPRKVA